MFIVFVPGHLSVLQLHRLTLSKAQRWPGA